MPMNSDAMHGATATMIESGFVPVYHHDDPGTAVAITAALLDGGATALEFTDRSPGALDAFRSIARELAGSRTDVYLGVGSIIDPETALRYIEAGASFVVGPGIDEATAASCAHADIPYIPGTGTVTEVMRARQLGAEIIKVFPGGAVGGPDYVRAVLAPCPWARLMPTGGVDVTEESLRTWFEAGVACVGLGSKLVSSDIVEAKAWNQLTERVRSVASTVASIRG